MNDKRALAISVAMLCSSLLLVPGGTRAQDAPSSTSWPQWGGPHRNFISGVTGLADSWPESGPLILWRRKLGTGHSSIVSAEGRIFTMYRVGNGRERSGPWEKREIVIALDAKTGETLWEHDYPSAHADFNFGAGPHSTPLIVDGRLFTIGTNKQLRAFEAATGEVIWSRDLIEDVSSPELLIRPIVKAGYGCSPIAYDETIICSVGGPGKSVMAFRQSDGAVVWKSGDFLTSAVPPILIDVDGEEQLVVVGGGTINGLDPKDGRVLWSYPHDPGNDLNCSTPLFGADNVLVVSSAYKAGSRALRLERAEGVTMPQEVWFTQRSRFMFLSALRVGDHIYGTSGDFGPAFLTAVDVHTGEAAWQLRGFARASMIYADKKAILLDEGGDLALAEISPEGANVLARSELFETTSWSAPALVGTTLFARDREEIAAVDLGTR